MYPSGMEIAPNGNVVVADTGNNQVAEYTSSGALVWRVGTEGNGALCGANPPGSRSSSSPVMSVSTVRGNVYVADNGNGRVLKLSGSTGKCIVKPFKLPGGGAPIGVTVSTTPAGQLVYAANGTKSQVVVFNTSGAVVRTISSQGACTLNGMRDAAADASGNIYVANYESNNIWNSAPAASASGPGGPRPKTPPRGCAAVISAEPSRTPTESRSALIPSSTRALPAKRSMSLT